MYRSEYINGHLRILFSSFLDCSSFRGGGVPSPPPAEASAAAAAEDPGPAVPAQRPGLQAAHQRGRIQPAPAAAVLQAAGLQAQGQQRDHHLDPNHQVRQGAGDRWKLQDLVSILTQSEPVATCSITQPCHQNYRQPNDISELTK